MSRLSKDQQDLIMDFYFRCGDEESINRGRDLIAVNPEAADLYDKLEATLTELDNIKYEPCPDNLVDLTIARLRQVAAGQSRLTDLLRTEQQKAGILATKAGQGRGRPGFRNFFEVAAVAALILIISGIGLPVFSNMRQSSWKTACTANFGRVGQAISRYTEDHEGQLPYVPMSAGSPWYKVGEQGSENQSNTRHLWVLVKEGYLSPSDFVCPGHGGAKAFCGDKKLIESLNDFPCRNNVSYSYILLCEKARPTPSGSLVIMADRNPLFEDVQCGTESRSNPLQIAGGLQIRLDSRLLSLMSSNHRRQGQNILRFDGSTTFVTNRQIGGDDIYTLKNVNEYRGCEIPCVDSQDIFLVP